jgi:hypothetical protein
MRPARVRLHLGLRLRLRPAVATTSSKSLKSWEKRRISPSS